MTRTFRKDLERKFDHFPTSLYIVFLLNEKRRHLFNIEL